jgi:hypothetical protein
MSTDLVLTADLSLVALTPADMGVAQQQLAAWCQTKIIGLGRDLREQRQNFRQAKTMKWKHTGWLTAANKTKKLMVYYTKIKAAVQAGYLIVPNFDVDVIAVRVQRHSPNETVDTTQAKPELLPPGDGRYVDDALIGHDAEREFKRSDGSKGTVTDFIPETYGEDVDFPASLVKPVILDATQRAMALRIFDRIGIVRKGRRSDPLVVGQIIHPKTPRRYLNTYPTTVTFFIAWWLDTKDL